MATYYGAVLDVTPEKASYAAGEKVRVKVHFQVWRYDGLGAWGFWHARVRVFAGTTKKDEDETTFQVAPWTSPDYQEHTTRLLSLGAMPSKDLNGSVEIWCGG